MGLSGRVKAAMGFQRSLATPKSSSTSSASACKAAMMMPGPLVAQPETPRRRSSGSPAPSPAGSGAKTTATGGSGSFARSFGAYFLRSSTQVQPAHAAVAPEVGELARLVEELRERESRLRTELLGIKILKETVVIVPFLETELAAKSSEPSWCRDAMVRLESKNARLRAELDAAVASAESKEQRILEMEKQMAELRERGQPEVAARTDDCSSSASSNNSRSSNAGSNNSAKPTTKSVLPPPPPPPPMPALHKSKSYFSGS